MKPVVPQLATGQRTVAVLTDPESFTLARWAAKTTFLLQSSAGIPAVIPRDAFCSLRDRPDCLPTGTFVFAFQDNGELAAPINGLQTQDWTVYAPYKDAIDISSCSAQLVRSLSALVGFICSFIFRFDRLGTRRLVPGASSGFSRSMQIAD